MSQFLFFQPFISSFLLLLFIFHIPSASAQSPLFVDCDNTTNYTSTSIFGANLNLLLPSLSSNSSLNNGFYNTSIGQDPNKAYGLVLCRGDANGSVCEDCIKTASAQILSQCPSRIATIFYDDCLLRYSNSNFLGSSATPKWFYKWNLQNVTNPDQFDITLVELMSNLSNRAAFEPRLRMFATGEVRFGNFRNVYGLVQCIRGISASECYSCLGDAVGRIPTCCAGKQGGRVFGAVCNIRYELYSFFGDPAIEEHAPPDHRTFDPPSTNETTGRNNSARTIAIVIPMITITAIVSILFVLIPIRKRRSRRKKAKPANIGGLEESEEFLQIDFNTVRVATKDFSDENKLGEGGLGPVYKGLLQDGREIAVKRLSINSGQGTQEFRNEVALVAKVQHRNLIRLFGCCAEGGEKLLIYEYAPNRSLDYFLLDRTKRAILNWECRYKIILGITRGLLYLHEDSRLRIIHRDLKASNILLDANMNPKISDFGMTKIFGVDQTQGNTSRIAGTYGYMSPEYAIYGLFSVKSDVFSFGVLLLEIVTGQRNNAFYQSDCREDLLSYAWRAWNNGTIFEIVDPTVREHCPRSEAMRCIHIGLLCVQDDATARPIMPSVALMLSSSSFTLAAPSVPAHIFHWQYNGA